MLSRAVSPITGENIMPVYGGEEAFLRKIIAPVYEVIAREAKMSKRGQLKDSQQRNYDVLNQFFWLANAFGYLPYVSCTASF
ncbi:callose synthase 3-like isoform X2 [Carica papaya]|uniref:callose synthase 3-like isoform X2 n=1 Tax=Carica papaya TaxID=3649 RepID=UPI000B8CF267|nr:callose synthase 3-like isoform X2 [Carica papaya]